MNTLSYVNFERRLDNIVDRICQQILYVESTPECPEITLCPPHLASIKGSFSIPAFNEARDIKGPIRLSRNILFLNTILNPLLEQYLTNPERAQGMYISKDRFHIQLAEMWLDECCNWIHNPECAWCACSVVFFHTYLLTPMILALRTDLRYNAAYRYKDHLIRANGTEKIFDRLRVVMHHQSFIERSKPSVQFFQDIIAWLEVSVFTIPLQC